MNILSKFAKLLEKEEVGPSPLESVFAVHFDEELVKAYEESRKEIAGRPLPEIYTRHQPTAFGSVVDCSRWDGEPAQLPDGWDWEDVRFNNMIALCHPSRRRISGYQGDGVFVDGDTPTEWKPVEQPIEVPNWPVREPAEVELENNS
jgi:hypothetical protein